ncbi:hypothetical protein GGI02_001277 [Coemansia sp. RSA 2322]|nr:hypothetical protein GGI02_001277 [Coemansia sp. RSA 2322]KAJ2484336.1 hypothetical protein EV174_002516 [Coemansia sp. RSA 2320]
MTVVVPDMPTPLSAAPAAMAFKHDRRRDYFTDSTTLEAAMGRSAPENAGIRYDIRQRSSAEPTTVSPTTSARIAPPTIFHIDGDASAADSATSGRAQRVRSGHGRGRLRKGAGGGSTPLFRRAERELPSNARRQGDYGPDSRLPRFILDRLRSAEPGSALASSSAESLASESSRASVTSNDSVMHSPRSIGSGKSGMQNMLELEEAKLLKAERKSQLQAVDSVLSEEQKVAYVGLVYLLLVGIQDRLNVQHKESQSSTASFMNFSRRLMRNMYAHIRLSPEEQRMIELLPRHKIAAADMAQSLAAQGDTIMVEADQDLGVLHSASDDELIRALRSSAECRSSTESDRQPSSVPWRRAKKSHTKNDSEVYEQYLALPTDGFEPEAEYEKELASDQDSSLLVTPDNAAPMGDTTEFQASDGVDEPQTSRLSMNSLSRSSSARTSTSARLASEQLASPRLATQKSLESGLDEKGAEFEDMAVTKIEADRPLVIDVRATLILDMFLLLLADEVYDSRGRYLLRCLASALSYPWSDVMRCERRVSRQLSLHDYAVDVTSATKGTTELAVKERAYKGRKKRMIIIGLATVGGGLVIGLSAGLLAPAIGAGIGATLGAIGVANTGAFFGSIGGTALITGAATLTGSSLAGRQITRRTRFAEQFEFVPCINENQTNLILTVPGWLGKADNGVFSFSTLDPLNGDHCSLLWEADALRRLGSSLRMIVGEVFSITLTQTLQHTVLPSLLGPLSIPMWLAKLGYVLDNPWSNGCELAQKAGPIVADLLLQRVQGQRPVTLIGYSIGARLIFYALLELASMKAYGLVEDVYLFGAPVVASEEEWRIAASVVGGRFVNAYSSKDWILGFFYRTTSLGRRSVAGMHPIMGVNGLENIDVSAEVPGHNAYREVIPLLLQELGVSVTSTVLHDPNEAPGNSEDDRAMISELERAAEMLEEHDKKKKLWARRWSFWNGSKSPSADASSPQSLPNTSPSAQDAASVESEADAAARELAELGICVKEVPSTLPALILPGHPASDQPGDDGTAQPATTRPATTQPQHSSDQTTLLQDRH